ncbi:MULTISPECIES: DUF397 domain-containing protein [Streptomyces]|uniref:DUF397 domain-containing protein n=1 Tax=Streptomyces californicus TaxID=67351 RepID=A0ABD7CXP2_9ACTN|nr:MULTISPECIES: DUF397 domain-containing protein [Streptomyces]KOU00966.1 toxin-antitoxin system toxin subunit [Streptomyces sp. NRRL F-2295]MBD3549324.1 DUF397 domain-containing protein [Streptomyces sp. JV180]QRV30828.1 DUF397 domain-containing protein [Streptomyces californicus]QRV33563.1 DUF397 domain-containing protein [Streptomyces californicus]QRV44243.1 DUF397 domain-containing protein [Streptomyces californicus]
MSTTPLAWFKSSYSSGSGDSCVEVALEWRKSSYSSGDGDSCVEVAMDWHKSSHSGSSGDDCVEVAACPSTIHVRDSKLDESPQLALAPASWTSFLGYAVQGRD